MSDMGWSEYTRQQELAEYGKTCIETKHKNGLIATDDTILECQDCELDIITCGI